MGREIAPLQRLEAHNRRAPSREDLVRLIRELKALCGNEADSRGLEAYRLRLDGDTSSAQFIDILL